MNTNKHLFFITTAHITYYLGEINISPLTYVRQNGSKDFTFCALNSKLLENLKTFETIFFSEPVESINLDVEPVYKDILVVLCHGLK
jgi:hypothetical protein